MTTIQYRYEVGYEGHEAHDNTSKFAEAGKLAFRLAEKDPTEVIYIFDRMARKGKAELWHVDGVDLRVMRTREAI